MSRGIQYEAAVLLIIPNSCIIAKTLIQLNSQLSPGGPCLFLNWIIFNEILENLAWPLSLKRARVFSYRVAMSHTQG